MIQCQDIANILLASCSAWPIIGAIKEADFELMALERVCRNNPG